MIVSVAGTKGDKQQNISMGKATSEKKSGKFLFLKDSEVFPLTKSAF